LMPNPKTGTVTMDVEKAVADSKSGKVTYRTDRDGNVHMPIGKVSFEADQLLGNLQTINDTIVRLRPASVKGAYIQNVSVASTFGPGVKVDFTQF
ncbi:50S ribosomal protein L1, partial [Clostridioides difficile]|nr:50S ribosomal protein L1 [Clostridioides difficile]